MNPSRGPKKGLQDCVTGRVKGPNTKIGTKLLTNEETV